MDAIWYIVCLVGWLVDLIWFDINVARMNSFVYLLDRVVPFFLFAIFTITCAHLLSMNKWVRCIVCAKANGQRRRRSGENVNRGVMRGTRKKIDIAIISSFWFGTVSAVSCVERIHPTNECACVCAAYISNKCSAMEVSSVTEENTSYTVDDDDNYDVYDDDDDDWMYSLKNFSLFSDDGWYLMWAFHMEMAQKIGRKNRRWLSFLDWFCCIRHTRSASSY